MPRSDFNATFYDAVARDLSACAESHCNYESTLHLATNVIVDEKQACSKVVRAAIRFARVCAANPGDEGRAERMQTCAKLRKAIDLAGRQFNKTGDVIVAELWRVDLYHQDPREEITRTPSEKTR